MPDDFADDVGKWRATDGARFHPRQPHIFLRLELRGRSGTGLGSLLIAAMAKSLGSTVDYDKNHQGCRAVLVAAL